VLKGPSAGLDPPGENNYTNEQFLCKTGYDIHAELYLDQTKSTTILFRQRLDSTPNIYITAFSLLIEWI
jgi:hypothetical protein